MSARRLFWPVGFLLFFLLTQTAFADDYSYVRIVRLSLVEGDVQLQRPDVEGWVPAVVNTPLQQGFRIYAGQGRAEIEFESGAVARLAPDSLIELTELILLSSGGRSTQIYLQQGMATFYANLNRQDSFIILTPTMQVTVPEQARFRVNVGDQATTVNVYKGEVGVNSAGGTTRVAKGQMLQLLSDDPSRTYLARLPERDDWDRWNDERDDLISSARTNDYVPPQVRYGVGDLDRYGSWLYLSEFGNCWQPYASYDWMPFSVGKWVWFPSLGYTWVSYEPWGWLPYHYGRWAYAMGYGWVWVPGGFDRFGPGSVGWLEGPGWIGWYPQGPGNRSRGTVVTTPGGFSAGHRPTPIWKRPDIEREGRPVERPNITPDIRTRMPFIPDEDADVGGRRRGMPPWKAPEPGADRPGGQGNVVNVAPRTEPAPPARTTLPVITAPPTGETGSEQIRAPRRPRPPDAGGIKFDPEEGRYVNVAPRVPEEPQPAVSPVAPIAPPRSKPPVVEREPAVPGGIPETSRRERITPLPTEVPRMPRGESPGATRPPKFEGMEPRSSGVSAPRERTAPPSSPPARIEHRPPSIPSQPPRMEPVRPMSAPPRGSTESARPSKKGE